MRAFLLFILFLALLFTARWYFVCNMMGLCTVELAQSMVVRPATLTFYDGDSLVLQGYDQFYFPDTNGRARLNNNNRAFLDSIARYLLRRTDRQLQVRGEYRPSEQGITQGFFDNLGLARAQYGRLQLIERGLDRDRITLDYRLDSTGRLQEPLHFEAYIIADTTGYERESFTFRNMTFTDANFAFDSDEFRPAPACVLYADSVKTYLEENPGKELHIVGHTDRVGTAGYNYDLGMRRAQSAKDYFVELGVQAPITLKSMGERRPVATNQTAEGRQKNRRVNFILRDQT